MVRNFAWLDLRHLTQSLSWKLAILDEDNLLEASARGRNFAPHRDSAVRTTSDARHTPDVTDVAEPVTRPNEPNHCIGCDTRVTLGQCGGNRGLQDRLGLLRPARGDLPRDVGRRNS